jgi:subtilisin family serine protease
MLARIGKLILAVAAAAGLAAEQDISDSALQQIRQLLAAKQGRSPAQSKLSSALVYPATASGALDMDPQYGARVNIRATVTPDLLAAIQRAGGRVIYGRPGGESVYARVPLNGLEALAARADVTFIRPSVPPKRNSLSLTNLLRRSRSPLLAIGRPDIRPFQLSAFLGLAYFIGSVSSQGLITHGANVVQSAGANGNGIRVGVLSDSAEFVPALIATGDLPPDTLNVADIIDGPGTSEGSAMMELVADLAPGAKLFFASAFNGTESFADNIRLLRFTYGCDVIVDDVSYSDESPFQDSVIARAVNDVTRSGAVYFSSAGNEGNLTNGNSSTWEGDFSPAASGNPLLPGFTIHSFGPQSFNRLTTVTSVIDLFWSDPLGGSSNDYDLFVLNPAGTAIVAASTDNQTGTQDPFEEVFSPAGFAPNSRVVIVAGPGAQTRALHLDAFFGEPLQIATSGVTSGHNASGGCVIAEPACPGRAFGVAAVAWNSARGALRPFPGGALNPTELFSSDGPRRIFFLPNGTPITPGNLLFGTNGGTVLIKPDITAADGTTVRTPGFIPFFGTSAAAPHAAAIAALLLSAKPGATGADIFSAMTSTALDIRAPGIDRDSGYGIVMAPAAVGALTGR